MLSLILGWFGLEVVNKSTNQTKYVIVDVANQKIVEECNTIKEAQRAQKRWHNLYLWHGGNQTVITKKY